MVVEYLDCHAGLNPITEAEVFVTNVPHSGSRSPCFDVWEEGVEVDGVGGERRWQARKEYDVSCQDALCAVVVLMALS